MEEGGAGAGATMPCTRGVLIKDGGSGAEARPCTRMMSFLIRPGRVRGPLYMYIQQDLAIIQLGGRAL